MKNFKESLTNQQKQDMRIKLKLKELEEQVKSAKKKEKIYQKQQMLREILYLIQDL